MSSDHAQDQRTTDPQSRITDALVQDARVVEARMLSIDTPLSAAQHEQARKTFREFVERTKLSIADIGRQCGRSASTISQWLSDTYAGDNDAVARLVINFINQHSRGERPGMPRGYVTTRISERMFAHLRKTQSTQTLSLIVGPPGVSKTIVCEACTSGVIPGSTHIELTQGEASPKEFAVAWARALGLSTRGTLGHLEREIIGKLSGTRRLQLIDESHYLSPKALNVVRDIHKKAKVGVCLLATQDLEESVKDMTSFRGQFWSLVTYRYDIVEEQYGTNGHDGTPMFTVDEVIKVAGSMDLRLTPSAAEALTELCCMPGWGGLRSMTRLLLKARLLAKNSAISREHLADAESSTRGRNYMHRVGLTRQGVKRIAAVA